MNINDKAQQIAFELQGSCESMSTVLTRSDMEDMQDNAEFLEEIDQLIFLCETCGWWCEISEMSDNSEDEQICTDCVDA